MIDVKIQNWGNSLSYNLSDLHQNNILCDIVITPCEGDGKCDLVVDTSGKSSASSQNCDVLLDATAANNKGPSHQSQTVQSYDNCDEVHERINAHSVVLAASSTLLCNALVSYNRTVSAKTLHVHNISKKTWKYVLKFFYLGEVSIDTVSDLEDVKKAAVALDITDMLPVIPSKHSICERLSQDSVSNTEELHSSCKLQHECNISPGVTVSEKDIEDSSSNNPSDVKEPESLDSAAMLKTQKLEIHGKQNDAEKQIASSQNYEEERQTFKATQQDLHTKSTNKPDQDSNTPSLFIYSCDKCSKSFPRKQLLMVHQRLHSSERPYSCQYCSKTFKQKSNQVAHEQIHKDEKRFKCETCGKEFLRKFGLKEHEKTHTGERPYLCQTCGKDFSRLSNLIIHKRIHTGIKPHECNVCSKTFFDPTSLRKHLVIHEGVKAFQCVTCGKGFLRAASLKQHQRIHTGERPFVCNVCDAAFASSSNLSRHKRFHQNLDEQLQKAREKSMAEKEHIGDVCDAACASSGDLNQHKKFHKSQEEELWKAKKELMDEETCSEATHTWIVDKGGSLVETPKTVTLQQSGLDVGGANLNEEKLNSTKAPNNFCNLVSICPEVGVQNLESCSENTDH